MTQTGALHQPRTGANSPNRPRSTARGTERPSARIDGALDMSTRRVAPVVTAPRTAGKRRPQKKSLIMSISLYFFVAVILGCLFMQISALVKITQNAKLIATIQGDIHDMRGESGNLSVRLGMQQNINRVREEAVYRLGMVQPTAGQIRVVSMNIPTSNLQMQTAHSGGMHLD